ncbi:polysaccharide biosynthesis/export family protein, partial [Rhizobium ruizarguesonis]
AALGGCTTYKPAPKAFNEATIQPYTLDSGDRLRITVFDQQSLTNTYTVDQAGYVAFPLIGQVPARGRTRRKSASSTRSSNACRSIRCRVNASS